MLRRLGTLMLILAAFSLPAVAASAARMAPGALAGISARPVLTVSGAVSSPADYTLSQLEALAATVTLLVPGGHVTATGVSLDSLVNAAAPVLPAARNALLRVLVTTSGPSGRPVTFALGELDPGFGNHDALVVLSVNGRPLPAGPAPAVPRDRAPVRDLPVVRRIRVGVTNPAVTAPPSPGALVVEDGPWRTVLSAATLAALPAETKTVTFEAGTVTQTHTETGPTLAAVLRGVRIRAGLNTWVAAVGSDGYVATVTPAEAWVGGRALLISLPEDGIPLTAPRLITDGDVKGGRYVSGVDHLIVGQGAPAS
jgi:hypothetical protein